VELEMYDYTSYNWSHWSSNGKLKEKSGAKPGKHSIDSLQKKVYLENTYYGKYCSVKLKA
jgi:hypothetical protein